MKKSISFSILIVVIVFISCRESNPPGEMTATIDLLPSWNEGETKKAITEFITATTTEGNASFVPVADRIAVFDNDGTLWAEQPLYFQLAFALDEVKRMAPQHPEWKTKEPFKWLLEGDMKKFMAGGMKSLGPVMAVSHSGMSAEAFDSAVTNWMATATHPKTGRHYNEMIYQPMLELLEYLRAHDYKTFIVSGGGIDFMRVWVEQAYGIPPNQVVGSSGKVLYEIRDSQPVLVKTAELSFNDDKEGKPVGIYQHIGKRPVFAAGNSDGDYQMLQWTTTGTGPRMGIIVHHTDSTREWAYDRNSHIGTLNKGLDDAAKYGWKLIDMKTDWKLIYPFDKK